MIRVVAFGGVKSELREHYIRQIVRSLPFEWIDIVVKKMPDRRVKELLPEEKKFLESFKSFHLLDVQGKAHSDDSFYAWLFKPVDRLLVIGPAIGFHPEFRKRAESSLSLSSFTLTHGLAQILLSEVVFRAVCRTTNHPFVK